ncbi:nuclear transport factor 2 family protein [Actinokineospora iranica]|uniref:SnoaL-like domain-containing protein n=1 Tax=Actinokineospora iranica TaxID=1271860 RepID=A0A1G6ZAV2_9PSEU|nr:nuclear transport factor 2 family protein [Actinokineospora iranica]SDD98995.1 SnoaL-like domain-containing protein [Actinokineospora iranica]
MTSPTLRAITDRAAAYGAAWNAHDIDGILDLQAPDMVFHLHVEGFAEVRGAEALRELFGFFFAALPDYHAGLRRAHLRDSLVILEYDITATLAQPFPVGVEVGVPTGNPMRVAAVDVLHCPDGGPFTRKDTYVDGFALRRGLGL